MALLGGISWGTGAQDTIADKAKAANRFIEPPRKSETAASRAGPAPSTSQLAETPRCPRSFYLRSPVSAVPHKLRRDLDGYRPAFLPWSNLHSSFTSEQPAIELRLLFDTIKAFA